jgi:TatD DNase family protein
VRTILSIGIGDGPATMQQALGLSRSYAGKPGIPRILATAGVHPHEAQLADQAALHKLDGLLAEPDVLAVGEIGLDYYYDHSPRELQKQAFAQQMEIAAARRRPIVVHCRPSEGSSNAWDDTLEMIEIDWAGTNLGGILHCFTGEWEHARRAMDCGFLISFAGNVTFPRAENIREVAARVPLDRMLIETDAPFLAPPPYRGRRNEPAWVGRVAEKLAEVCGVTTEQVASSTANNFFRFFGVAPDAES